MAPVARRRHHERLNDRMVSPAPDLGQLLGRLDALVDWERRSREAMLPSLAPVADLMARLDRPETRFRSVHVTGTKGKGSVCSLVAAGLQAAGWRVGRYASPHLHRLNERISLDGAAIDDATLAQALQSVLHAQEAARREASPAQAASWFDVMTAAALLVFAQARVDWAVIEVGLGGSLDSTNVVPAEVAVITNIGLEHTEVLGRTLAQIAAAKAGIVKPGASLVTPLAADSEAGAVVYRVAAAQAARVHALAAADAATISERNLALARTVLDAMGRRGVLHRRRGTPLTAGDLDDCTAAAAQLPGRLERLQLGPADVSPVVVVDGAHVGFALADVLRELQADPALGPRPVVLMALAADKDAPSMLAAMRGQVRRVVFVPLPGPRPGWPVERLLAWAEASGLPCESAASVLAGLQRCKQLAAAGWILATGSLLLVAAVRSAVLGSPGQARG